MIWVDANAEVRERNLFKNPVSGAWRMTVRFKRNDAAKPVELRAYLKQQQSTLTETWSYILPAEAGQAMTPPRAASAARAQARCPPCPGPARRSRRPLRRLLGRLPRAAARGAPAMPGR